MKVSFRKMVGARFLASLFVVVMCIQFVPLEGYGISPVKVALMGLSVLIFFLKVPYFSKALIWGLLYWSVCYFGASFQDYMRFSAIGYLGMFVISYAVYYNLVHTGAFSLAYFIRLLRGLIVAYGVVLVLQQIAMLVGIRSFGIINLINQPFLSLTKLPSLSIEPSHSARLLTVMMLGYLRCLELQNGGIRVTVKALFEPEHRWVTILFLWAMLTMGSGTAFIGLGLLCLYFIRWQTAFYIIPVLAVILFAGQALEIKQLDRALRVAKATMTLDVNKIEEADGSAGVRIYPIINTLKMDLTDKETWFGKGTSTAEEKKTWWMKRDTKLGIIEQYGLIAFIVSLMLAYSCMIRSFFCLETLVFLILFGMSLTNIYYVWGAMMVFTAVRYFQQKSEKGILVINDELYEKD